MTRADKPKKQGDLSSMRVCQWCGNDSVDDPDITWAIKDPDKPIGLCTACAQEVPEIWIQALVTENATDKEAAIEKPE